MDGVYRQAFQKILNSLGKTYIISGNYEQCQSVNMYTHIECTTSLHFTAIDPHFKLNVHFVTPYTQNKLRSTLSVNSEVVFEL